MDAPALDAKISVRPALRSIVILFSIIVISLLAIINSAHAGGNIPANGQGWVGVAAGCRPTILEACNYDMMPYPPYVNGCRLGNSGYWQAASPCALCSPNSSPLNTTTCTCNTNYTPDPTATKCVPACPAHAHGTPCVCDVGYKFDAAGTSCILEQYTVSLSGLGGVVMPTQTRTAYAQVNTSTGSPKSGIPVNLALTVVPENGAPIRAEYVGSISPNGGSTGADGRLNFTFTAPVAGGVHTITASCDKCTNSPVTGTITVPGCPVPPLTEVKDIPPNGPDVLPLTLELERTKGVTLALLPAAQAGVNCIKGKYPGAYISSGTRTVAYQQHFIDIWNKMIELNGLGDPSEIQACQALREKVIAEKGCDSDGGCKKCPKGSHCLKHKPAVDSEHPKGNAFDVSEDTIDGLLGALRPNPPPNPPLTEAQQKQADVNLIADWLAKPPVCSLVWGGSFEDRVHFQIP